MRCPEEAMWHPEDEAPRWPVAPREGNRAGAEGAAEEPEGVDDLLWNRKSLAAARW